MTSPMPLDPAIAEVLAGIPPRLRPSSLFDFDDVPATRRRLAEVKILPEPPAVGGVRSWDVQVDTEGGGAPLRLRVHERIDTMGQPDRPVLYWVHGGGMVVGSAEGDDPQVTDIVRELGCVAVAVDYRLAPEHPYPAPQDDIYRGLTWVHDHSEELAIDRSRLAIGGASAGGGLAASLAIRLRDRGGPAVCFQMLLCPMLDYRNITPSSHEVTSQGVWDRGMNERGWAALIGHLDQDAVPGDASPAVEPDLAGLPPAFIDVSTAEVFRDEAIEYASRLMRSGVQTELHVWPGGFHGYEAFAPDARISRETRATRISALRHALYGA